MKLVFVLQLTCDLIFGFCTCSFHIQVFVLVEEDNLRQTIGVFFQTFPASVDGAQDQIQVNALCIQLYVGFVIIEVKMP